MIRYNGTHQVYGGFLSHGPPNHDVFGSWWHWIRRCKWKVRKSAADSALLKREFENQYHKYMFYINVFALCFTICTHIYTHMIIYMHMFVHIHVNIYLFISTYTCTCMCIHTYIYISYTCIHLYAYYIDQPFTSFGSVNCCMRQRVPALFCFDWPNPKRAKLCKTQSGI